MKRTNVVLDEKLVAKARKITGIKTQRHLIDYALREIVRRADVKRLLDLEGTIQWDP